MRPVLLFCLVLGACLAGVSFLLVPQLLHVVLERVIAGSALAGIGLTGPYMYTRFHPAAGIVLAMAGFAVMTVGQVDDALQSPFALFLAILGGTCIGSAAGMWDFSRHRKRQV